MTKPVNEPKKVKVRRFAYDPNSEIEVELRETHGDSWFVYLNGEKIGSVSRYEGTLDRPISRGSRIVSRGKRRVLWSSKSSAEGSRTVYDRYTRADAIRWILPREPMSELQHTCALCAACTCETTGDCEVCRTHHWTDHR